MRGVKRVFAFCCLTAVLPAILIIVPLYLKHQVSQSYASAGSVVTNKASLLIAPLQVFKDIIYSVAESDIMEVRDGISTVFCQEHILRMNSSFNAFQLNQSPNQSKSRKHIRLKKSLLLPDDTLEYWGFYLMKGATVELKVCSRFDGSRILVVKGERNLRTCGLMDHNKNKFGANFNPEQSQVKVTFETAAEVVDSGNFNVREHNQRLTADAPRFDDDEAMLNHGGEDDSDFDDDTRKKQKDFQANWLKHDKNSIPGHKEKPHDVNAEARVESTTRKHRKRHIKPQEQNDDTNKDVRRRRLHKHSQQGLVGQRGGVKANNRHPRDTNILDGGINHGGNAQDFRPLNESDSISSFENALLECYDGQILVARSFPPSKNCNSVKALEQGSFLISTHEVNSDGYYYYIFYSDNDFDSNQIHAVFDIYKPSYLYSNISETKGCINSTACRFPIQM